MQISSAACGLQQRPLAAIPNAAPSVHAHLAQMRLANDYALCLLA